jgi:reverse gyrase
MDITIDDIDAIVRRSSREAVYETLAALGFELEDREGREELRADLAHLRRWRISVERVGSRAMMTAVTVIVTGSIGAALAALAGYFHLKP